MKKLKDYIQIFFNLIAWPQWYWYGTLIVLVLIAVKVLGTWAGFAYPFFGFIVLLIRKRKTK